MLHAFSAFLLFASLQDGKFELRWKLEPGQQMRYRMGQKIIGDRDGAPVRQESATTYLLTVEGTDTDGLSTIRVTYEAFSIRLAQGKRRFAYDSRKDREAPEHPAAWLQARLIGRSFTLTLTPTGKVKGVGDLDRVIDALIQGSDETSRTRDRARLRGMFSRESMRSIMQQMMPLLPVERIRRHQRWKDEYELALPVLGTLDFTVVSELLDVTGGKARFVQEMLVRSKSGAKEEGPATPLRGTTENVFSIDRGRFLSSRSELELTLEVDGRRVPLKVEGELKLLED